MRVPAAGLSQAVNGHSHFHTCVRVCHASGVRRDNRVSSSTRPFGTLIGRTQHLELRLLLGYFGTFPIDLADKVHSLTNRSPCRRPNVRSPDGRGQTGQPLFAPRLARPGLDRCERSRAAHSSSLKRRTEGQESHMTAGLITYHRGRLTIVDGDRLEAASCECYRTATNLLRSVTDGSGTR